MVVGIKKYGHRYPWAKWFARVQFSVERDRDFYCRPDTFAQMIRQASRRHGIEKIEIKVQNDEKTIKVKVIKRKGDR